MGGGGVQGEALRRHHRLRGGQHSVAARARAQGAQGGKAGGALRRCRPTTVRARDPSRLLSNTCVSQRCCDASLVSLWRHIVFFAPPCQAKSKAGVVFQRGAERGVRAGGTSRSTRRGRWSSGCRPYWAARWPPAPTPGAQSAPPCMCCLLTTVHYSSLFPFLHFSASKSVHAASSTCCSGEALCLVIAVGRCICRAGSMYVCAQPHKISVSGLRRTGAAGT